MDCDMIVRCDIYDLLNYVDLWHDVFVVKHDYIPKHSKKFHGNSQHVYPKKNWSSLMVFNNMMSACRNLSPEKVNNYSGSFLHQFQWTQEDRIGELPKEFNHLVGEYEPNKDAKIVHFTLGTPCFEGYTDQEFSKEWFDEKAQMNAYK